MEGITLVLLVVVLVGLYFLPTIVAFSRKRHNKEAIMVLNILLGWTFVAWVIALVWAMTREDK